MNSYAVKTKGTLYFTYQELRISKLVRTSQCKLINIVKTSSDPLKVHTFEYVFVNYTGVMRIISTEIQGDEDRNGNPHRGKRPRAVNTQI